MRISTVIPAYNRQDLIGETLRSVLSQTRPPAEVIVVDDGSTDGTPDVVAEQFGKAVTLIRQANAGAGAARNAGIARATGEIVHLQDSDDLSSLNTYAVQAPLIERGADVAYGPWLKTRIIGRRLEPEPVVMQQGPVPPGRRLDVHTLLVGWVIVFQPCLFRRALLEQVGPYRLDLAPSEDTELLYRIARQTSRFAHCPDSILLYRMHPENQISEQNLAKRLVDRARFWTLFKGYAAGRDDLSLRERIAFTVNSLAVAADARPFDPQLADALAQGANWLHHSLVPVQKLRARIAGRWRVMTTGHGYHAPQAAGPLTAGQRQQIALLGYELPDA